MTIVEFAKEIGLSTATVSRAFSGNGRISARTRDMVYRRAVEVGYRPNLHARNMVRRQSDTIGLFYGAPERLDSDYYVGELTCGIHDAARAAGRFLQTITVPPDAAEPPSMMLDLVLGRSIDGFIVNLHEPWAEALLTAARNRAMPYVVIDNTRPGDAETLSIGSQIRTACRQVGEYLVRTGRRHPAMIRGIHDDCKLDGLREGLGERAAGLAIHTGGKTFQAGHDAAIELLRDHPELDAVYCANDVLAMGAIRALLDHGRRVPGDVAVVGCDDLAMARFAEPALTTIRLPKFDMGYLAVRKLVALIDNQPFTSHPNLACSLVVRASA